MTAQSVKGLPVVLTCFALRDEYFPEIEAMIATVKHYHPDWLLVIGRGHFMDNHTVIFDIESPSGQSQWTLPVPLYLEGGENDWRRITRIKGWWMREVWNQFAEMTGTAFGRIMWLDADARLTTALNFEIDPASELIAGPWWYDPTNSDYDAITTGLVLFQGNKDGTVAKILDVWSNDCLDQIQNLRPPTVPWPEGDQEVLTNILAQFPEEEHGLRILKLDHDQYCGIPTASGQPQPDALVDHWMMSAKMGRKGKRGDNWPPPEHLRRALARSDKE
jgi:hypothetical protein